MNMASDRRSVDRRNFLDGMAMAAGAAGILAGTRS